MKLIIIAAKVIALVILVPIYFGLEYSVNLVEDIINKLAPRK